MRRWHVTLTPAQGVPIHLLTPTRERIHEVCATLQGPGTIAVRYDLPHLEEDWRVIVGLGLTYAPAFEAIAPTARRRLRPLTVEGILAAVEDCASVETLRRLLCHDPHFTWAHGGLTCLAPARPLITEEVDGWCTITRAWLTRAQSGRGVVVCQSHHPRTNLESFCRVCKVPTAIARWYLSHRAPVQEEHEED